MAKLITKCGYVKSGGAGGYMRYIATREGVERIQRQGPVTKSQQQLITNLLRDFPDAAEQFEYADYQNAPSAVNASRFITATLDKNAHTLSSTDGYMKYISLRPGVEKTGNHGLFGTADNIDLNEALSELEAHGGNVWTIIYSLRREDAARLGYDNAAAWQELIRANAATLSSAMKIPVKELRWYAAYHDADTHPHVHMMLWSSDHSHGFLTPDGIAALRSKLTNTIFKDELTQLYEQKDISYKALTRSATKAMSELVQEMQIGINYNPRIEQRMTKLVSQLESVTGKKQYGYLPKNVKALVNEIVDELAAHPAVAECYEEWNRLRDELERYYKETPRQRLPLSQQKEFRSIKNIVVREAESIRLHAHTFEDEHMDDEPEEGPPTHHAKYRQAQAYQEAKETLYDDELTMEEKRIALRTLEQLSHEGYTVAAHLLGKVYRDGVCALQDEAAAEKWFRVSADAGNSYSEYALGKLLLGQRRVAEAVQWLDRAASQGYRVSQYRLGKLYLTGEAVPKDIGKALKYLTASAEAGNQFAQYALGKLYLLGHDVKQDKTQAQKWFSRSAAQGNEYARFCLNHMTAGNPSVLLSATRLLHQLSGVFKDNLTPPVNPAGIRIDSKRWRKLHELRVSLGHKPDDHEETQTMQQRM